MTLTPRTIATGLAAATVLGGGGFATVYLTMFNPKALARVSLPDNPTPATSPGSSPAATGAQVTLSVTSGSFVGYRVREQLADLPAPSDAVGRTSAVTGSVSITQNADGTATARALKVTAELAQLQSDSNRRDNFLRNNALDTFSYPTATFTADGPVTIPASVVSGAKGTVMVTGQMTIHGVTKQLTVPLQLLRSGSAVDVVGSFTFQWGDYGVQEPRVPVASVQSNPTIEISLVLA